MHPYATDSSERQLVPLLLAVPAVIAAWIISLLGLPWWVDDPSVIGCYGIFYAAFNQWLWRWPFLRVIGLVKVPDLNGKWTVAIRSSFDERADAHQAQVRITQTWRSILIRLETAHSRSGSLIAAVLTNDPNDFVLSYEFANTPKPGAVSTMHAHRGSVEVRFDRDTLVGDGEYYSGRDRENQGTLQFSREA